MATTTPSNPFPPNPKEVLGYTYVTPLFLSLHHPTSSHPHLQILLTPRTLPPLVRNIPTRKRHHRQKLQPTTPPAPESLIGLDCVGDAIGDGKEEVGVLVSEGGVDAVKVFGVVLVVEGLFEFAEDVFDGGTRVGREIVRFRVICKEMEGGRGDTYSLPSMRSIWSRGTHLWRASLRKSSIRLRLESTPS